MADISCVRAEGGGFTDLGGGVSRRVLSYSQDMMMVEVRFEVGAVGARHAHPHTQETYVLSGRFRFEGEQNAVEVGPGDTLHIPPNAAHGVQCLEKGALLDVFAPMRQDFLA